MGKVRTEHVKRMAKELIKRFPERFSGSFNTNKQAVGALLQGATPKLRNRVAGYITHVFAGASIESLNENGEEDD